MRLEHYLARSAAARPDEIALVMGDERVTYAELEQRATAWRGCWPTRA